MIYHVNLKIKFLTIVSLLLLVFLMIAATCSAEPVRNYEEPVYESLKKVFPQLNDAACIGILSNIYSESGYFSTAVGDEGMSYGLCQWYDTRREDLYAFATANNWDSDDIETQIRFLKFELDTREDMEGLMNLLTTVTDDEYGANYAAYIFCIRYERPADTMSKAIERATHAQNMYRCDYPTENKVEIIIQEEEPEDRPVIESMVMNNYIRSSELYRVFPKTAYPVETVMMDNDIVDPENYSILDANASVTFTGEYMDTLPSGWHDVYLISDGFISQGAFMIYQEEMSTKIARPAFTEDTTAIIITDGGAPRSATDISECQDYGVVMWYEGTICYISTQRAGEKVIAPDDSSGLFGSGIGLPCLSEANLGLLDVSGVTNMRSMFKSTGITATYYIITGLDSWDVSNVEDMSYMFYEAGAGATDWSIGNLSRWNVSNVKNMNGMLSRAGLNAALWTIGDISSWQTGNVETMAAMFEGAGYNSVQFILDLRWWDVSKVMTMGSMFKDAGYGTDIFSLNVGDWNVVSTTNMTSMFENTGYSARDWALGDMRNWNVSNVESMTGMFSGSGHSADSFSLNFTFWDTAKVQDMSHMFENAGSNASSFELIGIENWNTESVKNMTCMFRYAGQKSFNYGFNLSKWNVSGVTDMSGMFSNSGYSAVTYRLELNGWNTSSVTDMEDMFSNAGHESESFTLTGLDGWNVQNVVSTKNMFYGSAYKVEVIDLNLSDWDLSNDSDMEAMFRDFGTNAKIFSLFLDGWTINDKANMVGTFINTGSNYGYTAPAWYIILNLK